MHSSRKTLSLFWAFTTLAALAPAPAQSNTNNPRLTLETKTVTVAGDEEVSLEAGHLVLPESRTSGSDRTISIPFYRLKSFAKKAGPPIFILAGGPGSSGIRQFSRKEPYKAVSFYREFGDVIVFDQRGTGKAVPNLRQNKRYKGIPLEQAATKTVLMDMFRRIAADTRAYWIEKGVDLSAYNTDENAADVNDLRAALGYSDMILIGGSYGSHLGLHILRKYPRRVARAIFYGVEGMDHTYDHPAHLQNAYERIAAFVERSDHYSDRLPPGGLLAAWREVIRRLEKHPVKMSITARGQTYEVWITSMLAQLVGAKGAGRRNRPEQWPELILSMYEGDYEMVARAALSLQSTGSPNAMKYAMDLASGISDTRRAAILADPADRLFGMANIDYFATKTAWLVNDLGPDFRDTVQSQVPVLLIHGTWDTSTPIENAREVAAGLINGHLIEVIRGNHGALYNLFEHWKPARKNLKKFLIGKHGSLPDQVVLDEPQFKTAAKRATKAQVQLWEACRTGDVTAAKLAIVKGADVNSLDTRKNRNGRRPLNWAARYGHIAVIQLLLEQGADLTLSNLSGFTPLHHGVEGGSLEVVQALLTAGANKLSANKKGLTAYQLANQLGRKRIASLLE